MAAALRRADVAMAWPDTPYRVPPGTVKTKAGEPFKVFTPFYRAWSDQPSPDPAPRPERIRWVEGLAGDDLPAAPPVDAELPAAGEEAAHRRLERFLDEHLDGYAQHRDAPGRPTSLLSPDLKWGFLHPRQVLERVGDDEDGSKLRSEVAWREFYADVLWAWPASARESFVPKMAAMRVNEGRATDERFAAWVAGRTGYPLVDAGMRQLAATAWMHNRVRM
ncbi:hypothetical protein B7486_70105, partial [cyanobacterium TDX16]